MTTKLSDFGKAFRDARRAGKKTFTWKGKAYTTQLREETSKERSSKTVSGDRYGYAKAPKNVPLPALRPVEASPTTDRHQDAKTERSSSSTASLSRASSVFVAAKAAERTVLERSTNRTKASLLVPDMRINRKPRKRNGELY